MDGIEKIWQRLSQTTQFTYRSIAGELSKTGWSGQGKGKVIVRVEEEAAVRKIWFHEQCQFVMNDTGGSYDFKNIFCWTRLTDADGGIRLEHHRRNEPVHLVDLKPTANVDILTAKSPHLCGRDTYDLKLRLVDGGIGIETAWRIVGPKKDENLYYVYR